MGEEQLLERQVRPSEGRMFPRSAEPGGGASGSLLVLGSQDWAVARSWTFRSSSPSPGGPSGKVWLPGPRGDPPELPFTSKRLMGLATCPARSLEALKLLGGPLHPKVKKARLGEVASGAGWAPGCWLWAGGWAAVGGIGTEQAEGAGCSVSRRFN